MRHTPKYNNEVKLHAINLDFCNNNFNLLFQNSLPGNKPFLIYRLNNKLFCSILIYSLVVEYTIDS